VNGYNPVEDALPHAASYHLQQFVEKYLKALLITNRRSFPKTHNLVYLHNLLSDLYEDLSQFSELYENLTPFASNFRYPGHFPSIEKEDALSYYKQSEQFKQTSQHLLFANKKD